jgi:hypothetical protein
MKPETLKKIDSLKEAVPAISKYLSNFVSETDTAVDLFAHCEVHPGLHSFMNMQITRNLIVDLIPKKKDFTRQFIESMFPEPNLDALYSPGNHEKMLMDSIFDEAIDEIVEKGFGRCISHLNEKSNQRVYPEDL